jgi:hypothetical protein
MRTRREFLSAMCASGAVSLAGCAPSGRERDYYVAGKIRGGWGARGHVLRSDAALPAPTLVLECSTLIIGAGISGLAAADALDRAGHHDLIICELGDSPGGNSLSGESIVSRYPWGAHYVPVIDPSDTPLRDFFVRTGIIRGFGRGGLPIYEETMLCSDPDERLWIHGIWQDGFVPTIGAGRNDVSDTRRFLALAAALRGTQGEDGRAVFALPLDQSSADPKWRALDGITFAEYLQRGSYTSETLGWYLNYCCQDDYGAPADSVSAWAGLHYFAARRGGAANATRNDVVTWPEGNGFLVRALASNLSGRLRTACVVRKVAVENGRAVVDMVEDGSRVVRVVAEAAILAVPQHVLPHLGSEFHGVGAARRHTPWAVANVTLSVRPAGDGVPLAWDNVVYASRLLGYVVADHQSLGRPRDEVVLTYYWPINHLPEHEARRFAERRAHADWCADFLSELYMIHPGVRGRVENVDIWVWGHGMACPEPGFCWGPDRAQRLAPRPPLYFCHTDLSGMSMFEEAFALGSRAAADRLAHTS